MDSYTIIASSISCLCCCTGSSLLFLLIVGVVVLRRRGKKVTAAEAFATGAEVSRAFVRGQKTREELMAEEDAEENNRR